MRWAVDWGRRGVLEAGVWVLVPSPIYDVPLDQSIKWDSDALSVQRRQNLYVLQAEDGPVPSCCLSQLSHLPSHKMTPKKGWGYYGPICFYHMEPEGRFCPFLLSNSFMFIFLVTWFEM